MAAPTAVSGWVFEGVTHTQCTVETVQITQQRDVTHAPQLGSTVFLLEAQTRQSRDSCNVSPSFICIDSNRRRCSSRQDALWQFMCFNSRWSCWTAHSSDSSCTFRRLSCGFTPSDTRSQRRTKLHELVHFVSRHDFFNNSVSGIKGS